MSIIEVTPSDALHQARNLIGQIQEQLTQLYEIVPYLEENPTLHESVEQTRALFHDAEELLRHPHLRIATIGTTSSGKSTLVNAMVGRRIAPMDAGELSAGILHLVHADRHRLTVKPVEGLWDEMDVTDLSDGAMYQHVREKVFKVFHEAKTKRTIRVPEVRIEGPLLATAPELLGLPEEVGVEIFDLPGLNSVQDQDNMKVIQHYLQDCFSIVVMHYGQTDKASREKLLREVKRVVDAMRGRTDATLFVLNRMDERKKDDDPLEVRIGEFANAIQHILELQEPPSLLPISALPLFYGQSAWGTSYPWSKDVDLRPMTEPQDWLENFQNFSDDCAGLIRNHTKERADIREWFNDRYDPAKLSVEELRQWLHWTWKWSHGFEFWQELRERVANRFPEIVIGPVLIKPLPSLHALLAQLAHYLETQRLENDAAIIERKVRLESQFEALNIFFEKEKNEFQASLKKKISELSTAMASSDSTAIAEATRNLFRSAGEGGEHPLEEKIRTTVQDTRKELIDTIIIPLRSYFLEGLSDSELEEYWLNTHALRVEDLKAIIKSASRLRARGMAGEAVISGIRLDALSEDHAKCAELDSIRDAMICLYQAVRDALSAKASLELQTRRYAIEGALGVLLESGTQDIEKRVQQRLPDVSDAIISKFRSKRAMAANVAVPDSIFEMPGLPRGFNGTLTMRDGVTVREREVGSCFKSKEATLVPKLMNKSIRILELPSAREMARQWEFGVKSAEGSIWEILGEWFQQTSQAQHILFQEATKDAVAYLKDLLEQRLNQSQFEFEARQAELSHLENHCICLHNNLNDLSAARFSGE